MLRFGDFLIEFNFSDLHAATGQWTGIPVSVLTRAAHEPGTNIDTELFDLLSQSYAYIGGHIDFKKPSDLPANHTIWYGIDIDGDHVPDAVKFAKNTPFGIKWTGGAANDRGKQAYINNTVASLRAPGNYAEVSDALMHILITRYQIQCVNHQAIVERIIGKSVKWIGAHPDGKYPGYTGFYVRNLGGAPHMKILLGLPIQ